MKILICLNQDIYCIKALNNLLPFLNNHQVKLCFSDGIGKKAENMELQILQNIEQDLSIKNIKSVAKQAEVDIDWNGFLEFEQISQNYQILDFKKINRDGVDYLSSVWKVDLIISIRFGQIFKDPIISITNLRIINLHSGILPNYRGIMPTFWAMRNGDSEIGTSLHFIRDNSIDTGDIIAITKIPANYAMPFVSNVFRLYQAGGIEVIIDVVEKLENCLPIKAISQNELSGQCFGKYFSYPNKDEMSGFERFLT